jgi:hypothetical protein
MHINNTSDAGNAEYTLQTDFAQPLKQSSLMETGARATLRRAKSDFISRFKNNPSEEYKVNSANSDYFSFNQDILSVYASYSFKIKSLSVRTGLRVEHTTVDGNFKTSKSFPKNKYFNVLPNIQVSEKFKDLSVSLSYNQRLQRPAITHLNPFIQNNDSFNISFGNPELDAQTIHVITLQTNMTKGKTSFGFTFSNRFSNNMIVSLNSFNASNGKRSTTFYNIGKDFHFQTSGYLNTKLGDKLKPFLSVNFQFRRLKNILNTQQRNSGIAGNTYLGATYTLNPKFNFTGYGGFEQSFIDLQTESNIIPYCGTGVNYQIIANKLRAGLMAQNYFFRYYNYRTLITGENFSSVTTNRTPGSKVVFTANWSFGKLKEQLSKRRGVTVDDRL